jgi:starvation-inducible outer membrane lipoprotein
VLTTSGSTVLTRSGGLGLGLFLCAVILAACASVVPDRLRDQARSVPFALLRQAPEHYAGTLLVLGGEVLALRPRGEWIEVAVLERPLGFRDRPRLDRTPRGRFAVVVRLDEGADQLGPGRLITVVGEVQGRAGPFDTIPDQFPLPVSGVEPLLMARYLHVWPPPLFPGGPNIGVEFGYHGSIGF